MFVCVVVKKLERLQKMSAMCMHACVCVCECEGAGKGARQVLTDL